MKVVGLYQYPVKSLRGNALETCIVDRNGLVDDRRWMVVDKTGKFQTLRECHLMTQINVKVTAEGLTLHHTKFGSAHATRPSGDAQTRMVTVWKHIGPAHAAILEPSNFLSQILEQEVDLVYMGNPQSRPVNPEFGHAGDYTNFTDEFPALLTSVASLDELNRKLESPITMERFRPNIIVDGAIAWGEDTWKTIRIGALHFRVAKPCSRCVVTTRDHLTGEKMRDTEPLQTLGKIHRASNGNIIFGQNLIPDDTGALSLGDNVEVLQAGKSNLL